MRKHDRKIAKMQKLDKEGV